MLNFDITNHPPTRHELDAERLRLSQFKKQLIKQSIFSDSIHGGVLLLLYLADILTGYGLLAVIGLGTVIALVMATSLKNLKTADLMTVAFVAIATSCVVGGTVYGFPNETTLGSVLAAAITGSIIMFSTLIGRWLLQVFNGLDNLKSLSDYDGAEQELLQLCRNNPQLEEYRQQALEILRPNLTLGELQAMRDFASR